MAHLGLFWHQLKSAFPSAQDAMPLLPVIESPQGTISQGGDALEIQILPDSRRLMLTDAKRQHLIQIQNNRFHHNWRKQGESDTYPRFHEVLSGFLGRWGEFESFLRDEELPNPHIVQCEMTYVNHIMAGTVWSKELGIDALFPWLGPRMRLKDDMPEIECALHFPMSESRGRLHATVKTGRRVSDKLPVVVLDLTVRGALESGQDHSALGEWFAVARECIIDAFVKLTGPKAHAAWGIET